MKILMTAALLLGGSVAFMSCQKDVCWQCHKTTTAERYPVCGTPDELQELEYSLNRRDTTNGVWICE